MKKRHLFWIIPSSIVCLGLLIFILGHLFSPVKTKHTVHKSKNKKSLTEKEIKKDLDYLKYYFENYYVVFEEMQKNGFDIDSITNEIYEKSMKDMNGRKELDSSTFRSHISSVVLKNFNNVDMHFSINGYSVQNPQTLYFSDIYIEPKIIDGKTRYFVIKNEPEKIPEDIKKKLNLLPPSNIQPGQEYTGPQKNLYEYYDENKIIYRYCVFTNKNIKQATISINGENIFIPVMESLSISNAQQFMGFKETKNTLYISMSDFVFSNGHSNSEEIGKREFQKLCDISREKSKNKQNLIIDLRNNGGGSPFFRNAVFANLMYNTSDFSKETIEIITSIGLENEEMLFTPPIGTGYRESFFYQILNFFKNLKFRKYEIKYDFEQYRDAEIKNWRKITSLYGFKSFFVPYRTYFNESKIYTDNRNLPEPDFKGNVYILTNRYSASCSEYSLALAYLFDNFDGINVHHIGENTCGAVSFVNPWTVVLPYSGGWMYVPTAWNKSKDFIHPKYKGEGYGWYPEHWTSSYNLLNTLSNLIDDPELTETLKGLERHHL